MPAENLTRAEAAERAEHITTHSYEVDLDLTTGPEVFRSTTVLRFDAEPGRSTFVDLIAPRVREVSLNGESLDPAHPAHDYFLAREEWALDLFAAAAVADGTADDPRVLAREVLAAMDGVQLRWLRDPEGLDLVQEWERMATRLLGEPGTAGR